jgi:hypothetical protein
LQGADEVWADSALFPNFQILKQSLGSKISEGVKWRLFRSVVNVMPTYRLTRPFAKLFNEYFTDDWPTFCNGLVNKRIQVSIV